MKIAGIAVCLHEVWGGCPASDGDNIYETGDRAISQWGLQAVSIRTSLGDCLFLPGLKTVGRILNVVPFSACQGSAYGIESRDSEIN